MKPRLTSFAPQSLIDDPWALDRVLPERSGSRSASHPDAAASGDGIEAFYEQCVANVVTIIKPLTAAWWRTKESYLENPGWLIISFGGRPAAC